MVTITEVHDDQLVPAVVYYRMSSDKQDTSISQQKERVETHFGSRYRMVEVYIDQGKSGSKDTDKRTGFLRMLHDLCEGKHKGKVKYILCFDLSRFGRLDTLEGAEHKKALRKARVKLATVIEGLIDWSTMTGRLMDSVLSESHHAFARLVGQKGLGGRISKVKEGQFSGGSVPYGCYKKVTDDKGNKFTIKRMDQFSKPKRWHSTLVPGDPEEVKAVKWLYKEFDSRDVSYRQLAMDAQARGFPSPTGTGWRGQFVEAILTNHAYVGDAVIGKKSDGEFYRHHDGEAKPVEEVEGEISLTIHRDAYTPLIARELWDRVQAKIARKAIQRSKPQKKDGYPLTGILYCGNCGKTLVANRSPSGLVRYQCKNASANPSLGCHYWLAHERELLPFILEKLVEHMDASALEVMASAPPPASNNTADIARLQKKLAVLKQKIERGREIFLTAPKNLTQGLADTLTKWEAERVSLEKEIKTVKATGDGNIKEWLRQQVAWWEEMRGKLIGVKTGESVTATNPWLGKATVEVEVPMETATLRELLHKLNAKVWLWFVPRRDGKKGWDIDRGRFKAEVGNQVYYDGPSTLGKSHSTPNRPRTSGG
jgi:DNA invertase Pin-like site-specific DNA recombinase